VTERPTPPISLALQRNTSPREDDSSPYKPYDDGTSPGSLGWIRFGHVSRYWRFALSQLRALWAANIGLLPHAVDEMLSRAGPSAPIVIHIRTSGVRLGSEELINSLSQFDASVLSRIRAVKCSFFFGQHYWLEWTGAFVNFLSASYLPALETLELNRYDSSSCQMELRSIGANAPNLRSVRLQDCLVFWSPRSLVTLSIRLIHDGAHINLRFSPQKLFDLIRHSSKTLEVLEVVGCYQNDWFEMDSNIRAVDLPRLRKLYLGEIAEASTRILNRLSFPSYTTVCVELENHYRDEVDIEDEFLTLLRTTLNKHTETLEALYLHDDTVERCVYEFMLDLYPTTQESHGIDRFSDSTPLVSFYIKRDAWPYHDGPVPCIFFTRLLQQALHEKAKDITSLAVQLLPAPDYVETMIIPSHYLSHLLSFLTNVRNVVIEDAYAYRSPFMHVLCSPARDKLTDREGHESEYEDDYEVRDDKEGDITVQQVSPKLAVLPNLERLWLSFYQLEEEIYPLDYIARNLAKRFKLKADKQIESIHVHVRPDSLTTPYKESDIEAAKNALGRIIPNVTWTYDQ
jgi:hypothetical protein